MAKLGHRALDRATSRVRLEFGDNAASFAVRKPDLDQLIGEATAGLNASRDPFRVKAGLGEVFLQGSVA
jgi:hypothetical protein